MPQTRIGEADRLFTVGYEGRSIDGFVELLADEGIERLVDVRDNPWSRKPGFTKGELAEHLEEGGVDYEHLGELGTPKPIRRGLSEGEIDDFEAAYLGHLDDQAEAVERLHELADERPTAVMCMERDVEDCHRQYLAKRMAERGFSIVHV